MLQITYASYKDLFSMISVVLAMVFAVIVIWFPINIIINIENIHKEQLQTKKNIDSFLKRIIREYRFDYFISRNFVFFLLLRNIAIVCVIIFLSSSPLTQSGAFINVSLFVSLWIAAMPIYNSPSYTVINLVALGGFGVIGLVLFWMIGNSTFSDQTELTEGNFEIGEIMEAGSLTVLAMYALHVLWQILGIAWKYLRIFQKKREKRRQEEKGEMGLELHTETSKSSKFGLLELSKVKSTRNTKQEDALLNTESSYIRSSRRDNSRFGFDN